MTVLTRVFVAIFVCAMLVSCSATSESKSPSATATQTAVSQEKGGQEEFGPYELVVNWPQPLPDSPDGVKHDGWTWGSVGAIYAETPDRIWIAQRENCRSLRVPRRGHRMARSLLLVWQQATMT